MPGILRCILNIYVDLCITYMRLKIRDSPDSKAAQMIRDQSYYFDVALPRAKEFFGERGWGSLSPACLSSLQRAADAAKASSSSVSTRILIYIALLNVIV